MSDDSNPQLRKMGRQPVFDVPTARRVLEARRYFDSKVTIEEFIENMSLAGEIKRAVSKQSMHRLLSGKMFPSLRAVDEAGKETEEYFDYSTLPRFARGRRVDPARADRMKGDVGVRLSAMQKDVLRAAETLVLSKVVSHIDVILQQERGHWEDRISDLEQKLGEMRAKLITFTPVPKEV